MDEQHVCVVCGYVHEDNSNLHWSELPEDYQCPECGVGKGDFEVL